MAPPARRRFETPEELQAKIEALSNMNAPPSLGYPELDARSALFELLQTREREEAPPPIAVPDEPEPARAASPPPAQEPPTPLDEFLKSPPPLSVQKPVPPKPAFTEYVREDNEPEPEPEPEPAPQQSLAAMRALRGQREPAYTPPPEQPVEDVPAQPVEDVPVHEAGPPLPEEPVHDVYTPPPRELEYGYTAAPKAAPAEQDAQAAQVQRAMRGPPPPVEETARAAQAASAPASGPDYSSVAGRVASTPQQGERPDPFGHDDDPGFARAEQIRQAQEAYGKLPDERSSRWEDEFTANNRRMRDQEIRRRSIAMEIFGGHGLARQWRNDWQRGQQRYDRGLAEARERDRLEARVPLETAEAFAASGQVSPEAAAQMRNNSGLIKQFGQFASQGGRAEHLDYQRDKMMNELHTKVALQEELLRSLKERQGMEDAAAKEREGIRSETQQGVARTYAKGRAQQQTKKELTPEEHANLVGGNLAEKYGFSLPIGKEAARGNYANVPPELREKVEIDVIRTIGQNDLTSARKLGTDVFAIPSKANEQAEAAGKKARAVNAEALELYVKKRQQDPQFATEYQNQWQDKASAVSNAWNAWSQMSDKGKAAFTQWAGDGFAGQVSDALIGTKDGQLIGPIQTLVNELVKERSGATVTDQEWGRLGREIGLANGSYSPFKGTGALEGFIKRAGQRLTNHRKTYERVQGGWK